MGSWHVLLLVAAAAALSRQQWDKAVARQGVGSILLALAAWQLGSVSAERVERAARYGVAVTLDKALSGAGDYEVRLAGSEDKRMPKMMKRAIAWLCYRVGACCRSCLFCLVALGGGVGSLWALESNWSWIVVGTSRSSPRETIDLREEGLGCSRFSSICPLPLPLPPRAVRCNHQPPTPSPTTTTLPFIKLSTTSLLELALARWLVDYWSQPPTFSSPELREMLVQAVSSMTREGLFASGDDGGDHAPGAGGSSVSRDGEGTSASPPPRPAPVESLTGWLEGRGSEVRVRGWCRGWKW